MKKIGIIGYGELGKQFEHHIKNSFKNVMFYYFDDIATLYGVTNAYPFNSFVNNEFKDIEFLLGLGYKHLKKKRELIKILDHHNLKLFTYIHPTAYVDNTAIIMDGCMIYPNVTIDRNVRIGRSCLINLSVTIAHDTTLQECCFLAPSVSLSGFVTLGNNVFIGTGACVSNGIYIQDSAIIGIGSVITKNVEKDNNIIGNPQKIVKNIILK